MNYDEIDALNWSTLKSMDTSPAYYRHKYENPEESVDKEAFVSGRAIHHAVLEPEKFEERYIVKPYFGDGRTKKAKEKKTAWEESLSEGIEIISIEDHDMAIRCATAIEANKFAREILNGAKIEYITQWKTDGIKCKGRIDAITDRVIDLKSTRHNTLNNVLKDSAIYNYHAQLAWYHDGAIKAGVISGDKLPVGIFIHASKKSKFVDIAILDMDGIGSTLEAGRAKYKNLLKKYIGCNSVNWWPGMAPRPVFWTLPEWKLNEDNYD